MMGVDEVLRGGSWDIILAYWAYKANKANSTNKAIRG